MATTTSNLIEYGLAKVYFAKLTKTTDTSGKVSLTYGTPVALPGAQSLTINPESSDSTIYADDTVYKKIYANNGYSGELTLVHMTDTIATTLLNYKTATDGSIVEVANAEPVEGALLFQFKGDAQNTRHILFDCVFTRGNSTANTKGDSLDPTTLTISYSAVPVELTDGSTITKLRITEGTSGYDDFYTEVSLPTFTTSK